MQSKVVAILETRTGANLKELISRMGAIPMLAPALEEVPDIEPGTVIELLKDWQARPFKMVIFQTGVGTRALFKMADTLGSAASMLQLLERALIVVRGPKPVGELNARQVRIDIRAASPFTTATVLEAVADIPIDQSRVLVQRYGETNRGLREALEARGAEVCEIATYRWSLPADTRPLEHLIGELSGSRVDAVVFTSAVQVRNLYAIAERLNQAEDLARRLNELVVASIGPVCSRALIERGVIPTFEASPPKLGPLIAGLKQALGAASAAR